MKEATIVLSDELQALLDAYRRDRGDAFVLSALTEAALRQYLAERGYTEPFRPLVITPPEQGSGRADVSIEHDRYLYGGPEE